MTEAIIQVRSFHERRAEIERLKDQLADVTAATMILCRDERMDALARGDEATAWNVAQDGFATVTAYHAAVASLDRFVAHIETAAKS